MALVQVSQAKGNVPVTVFQLQDRVNLGNYKELEASAKEAYENGTRNLVIDLSKSDSLTSIGIRAIVVIHKMLSTENGKHFKLAGVMPAIRDMLEVAGITQFIEMYDTVDEAVATF
ncbi:MAG TPA: STAS domain-containing protein [Anaerolineales bacterium]|nr:STAS domain-containing protein [Anaerolineales bacterium]